MNNNTSRLTGDQTVSGGFVSATYRRLEAERENYLRTARRAAEVTLPHLFPREGSRGLQLRTPFQSVGARGVNHLAAKHIQTLFPSTPFFRLKPSDPLVIQELQGLQLDIKAQIEEDFSSAETLLYSDMETQGYRIPTHEAMRHLLVGGNGLVNLPEDGGMRFFSLERYVTKRDPIGRVLLIITKEEIDPRFIPDDEVRDLVISKITSDYQKKFQRDPNEYELMEPVELFTYINRDVASKTFKVQQEVCGYDLPDTHGSYPIDELPWIPLRYIRIDGEDYGRGFVEEYLGDLVTLDNHVEMITKATAQMNKLLWLMKPGTSVRPKDLEKPTGSAIWCDENDVAALVSGKGSDLGVSMEIVRQLEDRLSKVFLLGSSIQRQAERVTAAEFSYMAQELEASQGPAYALIGEELQMALVKITMSRMKKRPEWPEHLSDNTEPVIVTGYEALGRGHELNKLNQFISMATQQFGPEALAYINMPSYLNQAASSLGIDQKGLVKTQEDVDAIQQQAQQQALMEKATPNAVSALGNIINQPPQESE